MTDSSSAILMVEDSREDYEVLSRSLKRSGLANPIYWCEDGDQAMEYLHHRGRYADTASSPRPCLILLDLNLPAMDGREVLGRLKGDADLRKIPVVVLTSSDDQEDIHACYEAGANSYVRKPVSFEGVMEAVQRLKEYWFEIVLLPKSE